MSFRQMFATLNVAGTIAAAKTAAYSAAPEDTVIFCNPTSGGFTVTLPSRGLAEAGKFWLIVNASTSTNGITVATEGTEQINGADTVATNASREVLLIVTDGANASAVQLSIPS